MVSVVLSNLFWIAVAIGVVSLFARRFVWKSPWVYAVVAAGCAEVLVVFVTGSYVLGSLVWVGVAIGAFVWLYRRENTKL